LNYRIDLALDEVLKLAEKKDYATLYEHDQLRKEMASKNCFYGFEEEPPNFPPTYRFIKGTREYDPKVDKIKLLILLETTYSRLV
jgi:hypothetical protein